jgi:hypothetical protein
LRTCNQLALLGLAPLAPTHPVGNHEAFELREVVQTSVFKLAVGRILRYGV